MSQANPEGATAAVESLWRRHLILSDKGPKPILANALIAIREAPEWQSVLGFDEFAQKAVARGRPPWEVHESRRDSGRDREWISAQDALAAVWLQHQGIFVSSDIAGQAVDVAACNRPFHPVREYLERLHWDGRPRLERWAAVYLGAADTPYVSAVASRWMISAIARIDRPGCKVDHCLILEGPQGGLKSTALKTLGEPWYTDEVAELGTKDASLQLTGVWILELAELDSMRRAEVSRIKAFLGRTTDRFRPPYGRRVLEIPRQCVFAGTVNHSEYLRDETGGRRFWPIECSRIDIDGLATARDQLWAEARARFLADEPWWLDTSDLTLAAKEEQEARRQVDPWEDKIAEFALGKTTVSVPEILAHLGRRVGDWTQADENRVARCLLTLGWVRFQQREGAGRAWRYRRSVTSVTGREAIN